MGRYYEGDINGKFWFGVQPSDAADRFGVYGQEPSYIEYFYDEKDLNNVITELKNIEESIGINNIEKLDKFFNDNMFYSDKKLQENGILDIWNKHKKDYVDYLLGIEIRDCIIENGSCEFTAEL